MMTSEIIIRQALSLDIDELVELLRELFSIEEDFTFDEARQRQGLAIMLENSQERRIMAAEINGKIKGMCSLQIVISTAEGSRVGLIEDMVISQTCREKGIGTRLLAAVEYQANKMGLKRLQLLADQNNPPALRFYKKQHWNRTQLICLRKYPAGE